MRVCVCVSVCDGGDRKTRVLMRALSSSTWVISQFFSPPGFLGGGDQAAEVVPLRLPAGVYLSPHQQVTHTHTHTHTCAAHKLCCFICMLASLCYLISSQPVTPSPSSSSSSLCLSSSLALSYLDSQKAPLPLSLSLPLSLFLCSTNTKGDYVCLRM